MLKTCPDHRVNGHAALRSDGMALGGAPWVSPAISVSPPLRSALIKAIRSES